MSLEDPTPPTCAALLLALPLVGCAGAALARRASDDDGARRIVAPAAGAALWLLAVYVVARLSHAFLPGLVGGTLLAALLGVPHAYRLLRGRVPRAKEGVGGAPVLLFVGLCTLAVFPAVLCYFHDELIPGGHLFTVAQLENGAFPPRFIIFPQFEFNYHYGFDVIAAALAVMLRLSPAAGVDVATVLCWVYTGLLGCHLGRRLGGARHGLLTGLFVLFGGGVHLGCGAAGQNLGQHLAGVCQIEGLWLNPPLSSYFFQHPFGAGIPMFLAVLALLSERASGPLRWRYVLFGVLFAALAHCQIVLFACGAASFVVAESFYQRRLDLRRARGALLAMVAALGVAMALGGFFAPAQYHAGPSLAFNLGVTRSLAGSIAWHGRSYGFLLPLGVAGLWQARGERLFLALMASGCLLVPNVVRYVHTWDIVKFTTVGELVLAITSGCLLSRMLALRSELPAAGRYAVVGLATLLAVPLVVWSASFHAVRWLRIPSLPMFDAGPEAMGEVDAAVARRLRALVPPGDSVYRARWPSRAYGQLAGLSVAWPDQAPDFGFAPALLHARWRLLSEMPDEAVAWERQTVRWFVLDESDESDAPLRENAERWVAQGSAEIAFEYGELRVVHLLPAARRAAPVGAAQIPAPFEPGVGPVPVPVSAGSASAAAPVPEPR